MHASPPPAPAEVRRRRRGRSVGLAIAAIVVAAIFLIPVVRRVFNGSSDAAPFDGDSASLKRTSVVLTLDAPLEHGKNAIWCAARPRRPRHQ